MSRPINGSDVFRAVAHPVRREILVMLKRRPHTAGEIVQAFRISQPSLSAHLRVLLQARMVKQQRAGRHRRYELSPAALRKLEKFVSTVAA